MKCVSGVWGECVGNVVPSREYGKSRKASKWLWMDVQRKDEVRVSCENYSQTSLVFSQFILVFLRKCHGDRERTFGCWILQQGVWRFGNSREPEVKVELVGLARPSCRIWGAVLSQALPRCADALASSCYCILDCLFGVLSCLVVLALTRLLRGKDAKNLWSSKATFHFQFQRDNLKIFWESALGEGNLQTSY